MSTALYRARAHYDSAVKYEADGRLEKANAHLVRGMHYFGAGGRQRKAQKKRAAKAEEAEEAAKAAKAAKALPKSDPDPSPGTSDGDEWQWPTFPETMLKLARKLYDRSVLHDEAVDRIILAIEATNPKRVPSKFAVECWIRRWKTETPEKTEKKEKKEKTEKTERKGHP